MEQFFHQISLWIGLAGGFIVWLLGGWDAMLIVLTVVVGLDYLMGVLCSIYRHRLCSDIGYKGIVKKVVVLLLWQQLRLYRPLCRRIYHCVKW